MFRVKSLGRRRSLVLFTCPACRYGVIFILVVVVSFASRIYAVFQKYHSPTIGNVILRRLIGRARQPLARTIANISRVRCCGHTGAKACVATCLQPAAASSLPPLPSPPLPPGPWSCPSPTSSPLMWCWCLPALTQSKATRRHWEGTRSQPSVSIHRTLTKRTRVVSQACIRLT